MTRYANLRELVAYFAASPEEQFTHDLGADEAVNHIPNPLEYMLDLGELTTAQVERVRQLEALIDQYCAHPGVKPWHDEAALFSDPSWAQIRLLAAAVLKRLPDAIGESEEPS